MQSEINCLVCNQKYFRRGHYETNLNVEVASYANNYVNVNTPFDFEHYIDVNVRTTIHNETYPEGELDFVVEKENPTKHSKLESKKVHKYVCENCGFIMSFIEEKTVESKFEERERKKKENMYDWTNFK